MSKEVFQLATRRNTHYRLGVPDSSGNIPKSIRKNGDYYVIQFTHELFETHEFETSYVLVGERKNFEDVEKPKEEH